MKTDPGRLAVALVAAGSLMLSACAADDAAGTDAGQPADLAAEVASDGLAGVAPGPESAATFTQLLTSGAMVDYKPTETPADAVAQADTIVSGTITGVVDNGDDSVVIEVTVDDTLYGEILDKIYIRHEFQGWIAGPGKQVEVTVAELAHAGVGLSLVVSTIEDRSADDSGRPLAPYTLMRIPAIDAFFLQGSADSTMHGPYLGPVSIWGAKTIDAYAELIRLAS